MHEAAEDRRPGVAGLKGAMRTGATLVLVAMAVLFLVGGALSHKLPLMDYVQAFGEAGLVGGCADWFAVVALFRHPFGLPIPHTAILAKNQHRIASAIGGFVADNFLTEEALAAKLADISLSRAALDWLASEQNCEWLAGELAPLVPKLAAALAGTGAQDKMGQWLGNEIRKIPAAPVAAHLLVALWDQKHVKTLMDQGLDAVLVHVQRQRKTLAAAFAPPKSTWQPTWLNRFLTGKAIENLLAVLEDMRREDHPWREEIGLAYQNLIVTLARDPDALAKGEDIKAAIMADPVLTARLKNQWAAIERQLAADSEENQKIAKDAIVYVLTELFHWTIAHGEDLRSIDEWGRKQITGAIVPRRHDIGRYFSDTVARWDTVDLVAKLENEMGPDFQYIRINGAIVGGAVGVIIHALSSVIHFR